MKKIITYLLLCLLSGTVSAQSAAIAIDSGWVTNSGGIFFKNRIVTYANGKSSTTTEPLGDTTQVLNSYVEEIRSMSRTWANDIEVTSDYPRLIKEVIRQDAPVKNLIGRSPLSKILAPVDTALIDSTYKIKVDGQTRTFKFTLTAQGVLRYRVDTFQARPANYLEHAIRLNNFMNTGKDVDIYRFKNGRWYNATKSVQVYLEAEGPQSRNARLPSIAPFQADEPADVPVLYAGGYALQGGIWYKWKSKKWTEVPAPKKPKAANL